ncbi:hypothetical protein Vafri_7122 [Volvox africanus]|uniref:Uncharacterized protein n=1 Tax=Volvox africanus TaxID=51714 RepID=A0A8J4B4H6_9CHLO|nr:hypothetical protein Vafri_7122 [Volvox africanus]
MDGEADDPGRTLTATCSSGRPACWSVRKAPKDSTRAAVIIAGLPTCQLREAVQVHPTSGSGIEGHQMKVMHTDIIKHNSPSRYRPAAYSTGSRSSSSSSSTIMNPTRRCRA